jgi:hypothetical protein
MDIENLVVAAVFVVVWFLLLRFVFPRLGVLT